MKRQSLKPEKIKIETPKEEKSPSKKTKTEKIVVNDQNLIELDEKREILSSTFMKPNVNVQKKTKKINLEKETKNEKNQDEGFLFFLFFI